MKNSLVETDPVYLADKPKRPHRIPVWLEKKEQEALGGHETPGRSPRERFGRTREHTKGVRRRYDFLFGLILNSGLRIIEALQVRVRDVRVADGIAKSVRVIGKGNRYRGPDFVRLLTISAVAIAPIRMSTAAESTMAAIAPVQSQEQAFELAQLSQLEGVGSLEGA